MSAPALTVYLQGLTTISADQANTFMQNGNTASDLRSFVGTAGMYVFIAGTDAVDDGNAGFFGWVSIAPGPDDDLNIIIPGGSGGAWVRITLLVGTPTPTVKTFQIRGNVSGIPAASFIYFQIPMEAGDVLPKGLTNSLVQCTVAPTVAYTATLTQNGSSIGTCTIGSGQTVGTWSFANAVTFNANDFCGLVAPVAADASMQGFAWCILGTRLL